MVKSPPLCHPPLVGGSGAYHCTAATPFPTAAFDTLSLVNATTTNAYAPPSDSVGPPSRILRRTRRRLPPTPSLTPASSSAPTIQSTAPTGAPQQTAGHQRLASPICCRCNGQGKCKNCVCVKQGRVCINCLLSPAGVCQNLAAPALPPPVPNPPPSASHPHIPPQPIDQVSTFNPSPSVTSIVGFYFRSSLLYSATCPQRSSRRLGRSDYRCLFSHRSQPVQL